MDYTAVTYEVMDNITMLSLDRPQQLNAFTDRMAAQILHALDQADSSDEVRVVIVTGRGRAFCAGADLLAGPATFDYGQVKQCDAVPRDTGGLVTLRLLQCWGPALPTTKWWLSSAVWSHPPADAAA